MWPGLLRRTFIWPSQYETIAISYRWRDSQWWISLNLSTDLCKDYVAKFRFCSLNTICSLCVLVLFSLLKNDLNKTSLLLCHKLAVYWFLYLSYRLNFWVAEGFRKRINFGVFSLSEASLCSAKMRLNWEDFNTIKLFSSLIITLDLLGGYLFKNQLQVLTKKFLQL